MEATEEGRWGVGRVERLRVGRGSRDEERKERKLCEKCESSQENVVVEGLRRKGGKSDILENRDRGVEMEKVGG